MYIFKAWNVSSVLHYKKIYINVTISLNYSKTMLGINCAIFTSFIRVWDLGCFLQLARFYHWTGNCQIWQPCRTAPCLSFMSVRRMRHTGYKYGAASTLIVWKTKDGAARTWQPETSSWRCDIHELWNPDLKMIFSALPRRALFLMHSLNYAKLFPIGLATQTNPTGMVCVAWGLINWRLNSPAEDRLEWASRPRERHVGKSCVVTR